MLSKGFRARLVAAVLAALLVAPVTAFALPAERPLGGTTAATAAGAGFLDWLWGLLERAFGAEGSIIDPDGAEGEEGSGNDPDGAEEDEGSIIDPDGSAGDEGSIIDPDG